MLEIKAHHKELKRAVNEVESKRSVDRSNKLWYDLRTLKKIKLNAKDKLNAIKSKLHAGWDDKKPNGWTKSDQ